MPKVPCFIKGHHSIFEGILGGHGQSPDLPHRPAIQQAFATKQFRSGRMRVPDGRNVWKPFTKRYGLAADATEVASVSSSSSRRSHKSQTIREPGPCKSCCRQNDCYLVRASVFAPPDRQPRTWGRRTLQSFGCYKSSNVRPSASSALGGRVGGPRQRIGREGGDCRDGCG